MMVSARGDEASAPIIPAVTGVSDPAALPTASIVNTENPVQAPAGSSVQVATRQVAPALISLATRTDGSHEMTVSLNPRDLGQVEVHLARSSDGTTTITVTASRPDVLQELSQNVHHLHAALDDANVPTDGRVMNFVTAAASDQSRDLAGSKAANSQDSSGASGGQNSSQGSAGQQDQPRHTARDADDDSPYRSLAPVASRRNWQLSGLNITA